MAQMLDKDKAQKAQIDQLTQKVESLEKQLSGDFDEVDKLKLRCEELENNVDYFKKQKENAILQMNKAIHDMNVNMSELQTQLSNAHAAEKKLRQEIQSCQSQKDRLHNELEKAGTATELKGHRQQELEKSIKYQNEKMAVMTGTIEGLERSVLDQKETLSKFTSQMKLIQEQLSKAEKDLKDEQKKNDKFTQANDIVKSALEKLKKPQETIENTLSCLSCLQYLQAEKPPLTLKCGHSICANVSAFVRIIVCSVLTSIATRPAKTAQSSAKNANSKPKTKISKKTQKQSAS